ncbi:MAG: hypothetical protein KC417_11515 [Myxococcales bacterium]|nr:hypothetical protein [Myxococcales bacterium]
MTQVPNNNEVAAARRCVEDAWRGLGARSAPDFLEIFARYGEPHRAYHTFEHVLECLGWLEACEELAEHPLEIRLALVYHDVVCAPGCTDNEVRSGDLFRVHAEANQLPNGPTERIVRLIEGTALHQAHGGDGALVNDIDLAVFGSSPRRFAQYDGAVRKEYGHVDEAVFRRGRRLILRSFLEGTAIYRTPFFGERLEAQARKNLARAIAALGSTHSVGEL